MSLKLTLRNSDGDIRTVTVPEDGDLKTHLEQHFDIRKGYGFSLELWEDSVRIVDYFHGETRAEFRILSREQI